LPARFRLGCHHGAPIYLVPRLQPLRTCHKKTPPQSSLPGVTVSAAISASSRAWCPRSSRAIPAVTSGTCRRSRTLDLGAVLPMVLTLTNSQLSLPIALSVGSSVFTAITTWYCPSRPPHTHWRHTRMLRAHLGLKLAVSRLMEVRMRPSVYASVRKLASLPRHPNPYLSKHPDFNRAQRMVTCSRMAADLCGRSQR
jgi:hypothetical protein